MNMHTIHAFPFAHLNGCAHHLKIPIKFLQVKIIGGHKIHDHFVILSILHFLQRASGDRSVAGRAARRVAAREGRPVQVPREPTPGSATDIDDAAPAKAPS